MAAIESTSRLAQTARPLRATPFAGRYAPTRLNLMTRSTAVDDARSLLLSGDGARVDEAFGWLDASVQAGDAEAAKQLATLHASGAWRPRNWDAAFRYLARAAELGSASARGQLEILAPGGRVLDWLDPQPTRQAVCEQPRVRLSPDFASPEVCAWLIGLARGRLVRAKMVEGYDAEPKYTNARTNSDFTFTVFDADCVLAMVRERISLLLKLPVAQMEPPQIFHYAPGQELRPHVDYLQRSDRLAQHYQGDRIATFLLYLNEDFDGGETWFVRPDLKLKGQTGDAIYFANVGPDGAGDPESLHAGLPPTRGEKWLLSQWVHDRPFAG